MGGEKEAAYPRRPLQKRPEKPDLRLPWPTPLPLSPSEGTGRLLQRILERLDAIEKRLEEIEKTLMQQRSTP